jgi:hypothetical protein
MISQPEFDSLVAIYETHGWVLRRVVANGETVKITTPKEVHVENGTVDAAWFSRPPTAGSIAWEIRYLGGTQYALVEHLDEASHDFEDKLHQTEQRLADAVAVKQAA